jgi:hypothetical protein
MNAHFSAGKMAEGLNAVTQFTNSLGDSDLAVKFFRQPKAVPPK